MHYEIKAFDKIQGTALVRFWTDDYPDGLTYGVDVPIVGGSYIDGDALGAHIMSFAPYGQIARLVAVAALDAYGIESLVVPKVPEAPKTPDQIKADLIHDIERILAEKLVGGFMFNGVTWHCDPVFQGQINSFLTAWREEILPLAATVKVRDFGNIDHLLTRDEVRALGGALMVYVRNIYADAWAAKDALI